MFVGLDPATREYYRQAMDVLDAAGVPYLVGGAYAMERYTGVARHTKDFDVFVRPRDARPALEALGAIADLTELTFPHWLGKAFRGDAFVDVIFRSGNAVAEVDDDWFAHAVDDEALGRPVRLCPVEEILWSKAYVMERERFDGADMAHLIRARADQIDWPRLVRRFGPHARVLLAHLVLFGFIYPDERAKVPAAVLRDLFRRVEDEQEQAAGPEKVCQGTLLSRAQYLVDLEHWGYRDGRLRPRGPMSAEDIARWTAAIERDGDLGHATPAGTGGHPDHDPQSD